MRVLSGVIYREWGLFLAGQSAFWLGLVTPFLYLLFFLPGVGLMLGTSEHSYVLFAFPGVLLIIALHIAQSVGAPIFFDRYTGEIETLFTLPVPRYALVLGRLGTAVARTGTQSAVTLILAAAIYPAVRALGPGPLLLLVAGAGGIALVLTAMFIWMAAAVRDQGQFNLIMNLTITPLLLTSSAFYPIENFPVLLRYLAAANPLTYLLAILRATMGLHSLTIAELLLAVSFTAALLAGAIYRYQRLSR